MVNEIRAGATNKGEPSPSDPPGSVSERALERHKLQLETEILESRISMEQEKLALEIQELREAPKRTRHTMQLSAAAAVLASITTIVVAVASGYITWQVQSFANRQKESDTYALLLQNLGSTNAPARAGAVVGLTRFAIEDRERSRQTVTILITQLTSESDSRVLRLLIPALVSIGPPALDEVLRANRAAYQKYRREVQRFIASSLHPLSLYAKKTNGRRGEAMRSDASSNFYIVASVISPAIDTDLLTDAEAESEVLGEPHHFDKLDPFYRVAAGADNNFGLAESLLEWVPARAEIDGDKEWFSNFLEEGPIYARNLYVTSLVVGRMISALSGRLNGQDLRSVAVLFADFNGKSLAGAHLEWAFISGNANRADFTGASLGSSNLSGMNFATTNLSFTSLGGATLPRTLSAKFWKINYLGNSNLTGADWWNSANVRYDSTAGVTVLLDSTGASKEADFTCPLDEARPFTRFDKQGKEITARVNDVRDKRIEFSVNFCPQTEEPQAEASNFEAAFPRRLNEQKHVNWERQHASSHG